MSIGSFFKKLARAPLDAIKGTIGYQSGKDRREAYGREDAKIQRTVADARAAGVHPLFALGGATGGPAAFPKTGSQIGEAFRFLQKSQSNRRGAAKSSLVDNALIKQAISSARLSDARADLAVDQLNNSINKRAESVANISQDGPINMEAVTRFHPVKSKKYRLPGVTPAWNKFNIYKDLSIWAPSQEMSEVFESVAMWPMIYEENYKEINAWIHRAQGRNWKALKKRHPAYKFMRWVAEKSKKFRKPIAYPMEVSP